MSEINVKEVRSNLSEILDRVEQGEDIIVTRRGKRVARITSPEADPRPLGSLRNFRERIHVQGNSLSETIIRQREAERY